MKDAIVKKLYYCPVKSLSFNENKTLKILKNIGIKNDRCIAFTRGINRKLSDKYKFNNKIRNLNNFLTLRNSPFLRKYNFIYDDKSKIVKLFLGKKKLLESYVYNKTQIKTIEKFIEILDKKIKKPIHFIYNNKLPFFDTMPDNSISLINLNTIKDLELKLNKKIEFERFRGNIYIDNLEPWKEFKFVGSFIKIGNIKFKIDSKIPRCVITNINPKNYSLDINLPKLLSKNYNHHNFGIYLTPKNSGIIKVNNILVFNCKK